jgi:hypothetical protein
MTSTSSGETRQRTNARAIIATAAIAALVGGAWLLSPGVRPFGNIALERLVDSCLFLADR